MDWQESFPGEYSDVQKVYLQLLDKLRREPNRQRYCPRPNSPDISVCEALVERGVFRTTSGGYAYTEVCVNILNGSVNPAMVLGIRPRVPQYAPSLSHVYLSPQHTLLYDATAVFEEFRHASEEEGFEYEPQSERDVVACDALAEQAALEPCEGRYRLGATGEEMLRTGRSVAQVLGLDKL